MDTSANGQSRVSGYAWQGMGRGEILLQLGYKLEGWGPKNRGRFQTEGTSGVKAWGRKEWDLLRTARFFQVAWREGGLVEFRSYGFLHHTKDSVPE